MLDTKTDTKVRSKGILSGQRIIVLGACCGFGRSMSRALAASGAQVVAADTNTEALDQITGAVPLTLKGTPEEAVQRVGRAWGEARLDAVLNLMPLRWPEKIDMNIAVLQACVQSFMPALVARQGQILTVVVRPEQALDVAKGAMLPALASAQDAFAQTMRRDGLALNLVSVSDGIMTPARKAVVGLLGKTLGSISGADLRL